MELIKGIVNFLSYPQWSFTLSIVLFGVLVYTKFMWTKKGGIFLFVGLTVFYALAVMDPNFRAVVAKPDNVPITMMVFLVAFFIWLAMYKAHRNDDLTEEGSPTFEKSESEDKIFTWPDLVFSEFIFMVILTVVLVVWSIALPAPLEEPADPSVAPNPSKAPWYFLGLQEMLVYFDPWMAGVVLPGLIVLGLMAIPYIDTSKKGNGYYTFRERKLEIVLFLFGFMILWTQMIVIGTFLRGPNWNFFGPFEFWDINKIEPLVNVDLSEYFWIKMLGTGLPGHWLIREAPGLILMALYLLVLPIALTKTKFVRNYYDKMGPARYYTGIALFLMMLLLPIKMYCRWLFNMKYFVHIQEFFFNI